MDIGHGHRQAVLLMYLWSVLISASALAIGLVDGRLTVFAIVSGAAILFLVTALPRLSERRRNGNGDEPGPVANKEGPTPSGMSAAPSTSRGKTS
jgi:UDP-GlcNAc:undecaprenyl-phosphate GlcNAc-1-phosphate transferase